MHSSTMWQTTNVERDVAGVYNGCVWRAFLIAFSHWITPYQASISGVFNQFTSVRYQRLSILRVSIQLSRPLFYSVSPAPSTKLFHWSSIQTQSSKWKQQQGRQIESRSWAVFRCYTKIILMMDYWLWLRRELVLFLIQYIVMVVMVNCYGNALVIFIIYI